MDDEIKIFKQAVVGGTYHISKHIGVRSPTLGEICDFGEIKYYSMVSMLCSNPSNYKVALWDEGIDWETIDDWDLFVRFCHGIPIEYTNILLGDLDFTKLKLVQNNQSGELVLVKTTESNDIEIVMDRSLYTLMTNYIRNIHGFEYKEDKAENKLTRRYMVERERRRLEKQKDDTQKSMLKTLVTSMISQQGFDYNYTTIWDLSIAAFNESVSRIQKYLSYIHTMQGVYAGTISSKDINFEEINWIN